MKINMILAMAAGVGIALASQVSAQNFFGQRAYFQTSNGSYFMAMNGGGGAIYGNSGNRLPWEEFEIWDLNGGDLVHGDVIALRTAVSRHYVSDNGGQGPATADRGGVAGWELFQARRQNGGGRLNSGDLLVLRGWHGQHLAPRYDWDGWRVGSWFPWIGSWEVIRYIDKHDTPYNRSECVFYARDRLGSGKVPYGLITGQNKINVCNVRRGSNYNTAPYLLHSDLAVGDMVVIRSGSYGHVAVLEQKHDDGTVTIHETNYPTTGNLQGRRGTPSQLKIIGARR